MDSKKPKNPNVSKSSSESALPESEEILQLKEKLLKTETELQDLSDTLGRSNHEFEQFAAMASHDLQEPLFTVKVSLDLLKVQFAGKLDPKTQEFMDGALEGVQEMKVLIHDILAYSRVTSRGSEFKRTELEFVFENALRNLASEIESTGAVITHDPLPPLVCDLSQIRQVFQSLIGNSLKFRSEGKPLVHLSVRETESEWVFSVKDNGIGFDPKYLDQIFVIFRRLNPKSLYPGSGAGLAISKKIIERHHGRLWAESEPGKGSTFFFSLPR